jgi:hypothetical protein
MHALFWAGYAKELEVVVSSRSNNSPSPSWPRSRAAQKQHERIAASDSNYLYTGIVAQLLEDAGAIFRRDACDF